MNKKLLEVKNLVVEYRLGTKIMRALDNISFSIKKGEVLGIAGESGCGKSSLGLAIMRLLPRAGKISQGKILFKERNLLRLSETEMNREIRGREIAMIFQNPLHALNPVFTIETQMVDIMRFNLRYQQLNINKKNISLKDRAIELLRETGLADPEERITDYPFQFSGGMKQRVMIAMAFISNPPLLIADEPTTALDVTIEAEILALIINLVNKYRNSVLYISHDLGVISEISDRVMIIYAGKIVEMADSRSLFDDPRHPYTRALLESLPGTKTHKGRLPTIPGCVPLLDKLPKGCSFHPRCPFVEEICKKNTPEFVKLAPNHWVACLREGKLGRRIKCFL